MQRITAARRNQEPDDERGFTLIELLIVVAIIGIIAAIAVPSLLRARVSANEAQAIGDTRTVISANQMYASANCGFFAEKLKCMSRKTGICIPNYPAVAPDFLGANLAQDTPYDRRGYRRDYKHVGEVKGLNKKVCAKESALDFCYMSTPAQLGTTGVRAFSGTGAGRILLDTTGTKIPCPAPLTMPSLE